MFGSKYKRPSRMKWILVGVIIGLLIGMVAGSPDVSFMEVVSNPLSIMEALPVGTGAE